MGGYLMIPVYSMHTAINYWFKLRCFGCNFPLEINDIDENNFVTCRKCTQKHFISSFNKPYQKNISPTHKTVSSLLPNGSVSRRRVDLSEADKQQNLFGGAL
jgi:hypothetical protein